MREQRQVSEWILSCHMGLILMWGCIKDICCHLFAVVVDVVTELERVGVLSELLYADDLVQTSETIKGLRNKFLNRKEAFTAREAGKTKVSDGITEDGVYKAKVAWAIFALENPSCGVYSFIVKADSALCMQCVFSVDVQKCKR